MVHQKAPPGYEPVELGSGFSAVSGRTLVHRRSRKLVSRIAERHANSRGVRHGGALATFADAQIVVVKPRAAEADNRPTISATIDDLAPNPLGAWVAAEVTLGRTQTLIFSQAVMTAGGEPLARSSAIYRTTKQTGGRT
ncbi:MAG: PaaI family thioesterase [Alphaproteobacteria bacterium]|nr:PaaI family thioesterase [Alphaproteobacteria bacterium]